MYYGFNFNWIFMFNEGAVPEKADPAELDFMAEEGFNFVRIPIDYRFLIESGSSLGDSFESCKINEHSFEMIDGYIEQCSKRGLHTNLCLHRAPGYCINRPELESSNLWRDEKTEKLFVSLWRYFAQRYKDISSEKLSFDIINEPANLPPTHPCTREDYSRVIRHTINDIRKISPDREITIDGWDGGGHALPELADVDAIHSGRGYEPFPLTHYKAQWTYSGIEGYEPIYPGYVQPNDYKDINSLRKYYEPWKELSEKGVRVHIGEFGCYNNIPNDIALNWLKDFTTIMKENKWGYSMWNFNGAFGIIEHGRPGTKYTEYKGFKVDMEMLRLLKEGMV